MPTCFPIPYSCLMAQILIHVHAGRSATENFSFRSDKNGFSTFRIPDAGFCNVLFGASVAARVVIALSSQHPSSNNGHHDHQDHDHHHSRNSNVRIAFTCLEDIILCCLVLFATEYLARFGMAKVFTFINNLNVECCC